MFGIRFIKFDAMTHVIHYKKGRVKREGRGLAFYYYEPSSSIAAVPLGSNDVPFIFNETTLDYQTVSIQGQISYRVSDAKKISEILDFTVDADGLYKKDESEKLTQRIINEAQTATSSLIHSLSLKDALRSAKSFEEKIAEGLKSAGAVNALGLDILSVNVLAVKATPEMERALETETREGIQQGADQAIYARRAAADHAPDLLSRLLAARDDEGGRMSDKQVRDEVLTLFVAGHETTATALAWSIHCLCNHPEIAEAVQREADALPGPPTFADLPRLPLALRVFKEALRLYPPVYFFGRQAIEPVTVDGVSLPRDTVVLIAPHALHRRPELYPDPERFDPDRFLPEREAARPKLAWLPFGAGPRVCIGNHFAMMEGQLVLAELLRHARFEAIGVDTPDPGATLRPSSGMKMRVRLRRTARSGAVGREPAAHPS